MNEWMERTEQARRLLVEPRLGAGARIQATVEYRQQAAVLEERLLAFDWIEVIVAYLEESLAAYDVRRHKLRTSTDAAAILNEVVELLREIRVINTRPLITMIEGARPGLFTFLTVLEGKLQQVEVCWQHVTGCRRFQCAGLRLARASARPFIRAGTTRLPHGLGRAVEY